MTTTIAHDVCDGSQRLALTHTRGDRLAVVARIDGTASDAAAALLAAWTGADWLAQVRATRSAATIIDSFEVSESIEDGIGVFTFVIDDTTGWDADDVYYFDFERTSGAGAPVTYFAGSTIAVEPDVSREEVGS